MSIPFIKSFQRLTIVVCLLFYSVIAWSQQTNCILNFDYSNYQSDSPTCGLANGSIKISASGIGEVTYQLNDGPIVNEAIFDNLNAGDYVITAYDDVCSRTFSFSLPGQESVTVDKINTKPSDCGQSNGTITVLATGERLTYSINNKAFQSSNKFTGLSGGNYKIRVKDVNGCEESSQVIVAEESIKLNDISVQHTNCSENNGTITIDADGNNLQYRINGVRGWTSNAEFQNLPPGEYQVQMRDRSACVFTRRAVVRNTLDVKTNITEPLCNQSNGVIELSVNTPGNYEYKLNESEQYQSSNRFTNLSSSEYKVTIRLQGSDCEYTKTIQLEEDAGIKIENIDLKKPTCLLPEGRIEIIASGNDLSYTLSNDEDESSNETGVFENLVAGTYSLTVLNSVGCSVTQEINLPQLENFEIVDVKTTPSSCNRPEGSLHVLTKSTSRESLQFSIDGSDFKSEPSFEELFPGEYQVTVRSQSGCELTKKATVLSTEPIIIDSTSLKTPTSNCSEDGVIKIYAQGEGFTYSIDSINYQESNEFTGLNPGDYNVFIRYGKGCFIKTGSIKLPTNFSIDTLITSSANCSQPIGGLKVEASGNQLEYRIDDGPYQSEPLFDSLSVGLHTLYVRDINDCLIEEEFQIESSNGINLRSFEVSHKGCEKNNAVVELHANSKADGLQFKNGNGEPQSDSVFTELGVGRYQFFAQNDAGCIDSIDVVIDEASDIELSAEVNHDICFHHPGKIWPHSKGGVGEVIYSLQSNQTNQRALNFEELRAGTYTLTAIDEMGCKEEIEVLIEDKCNAMVPTSFAPNQNSKNERLALIHEDDLNIKSYQVFNTWGELVYEQSDFSTKQYHLFWDGGHHQQGVYFYQISFEDLDGNAREIAGFTNLIR